MSKRSKNKQPLFFFITLGITNVAIASLVNHVKALSHDSIPRAEPNPIHDFDYLRALNTYLDDKRNIQLLGTDQDPDQSTQTKSHQNMSKKTSPYFRVLRSYLDHSTRNKRFLSFSPLLLSHLRFNLKNKQFLTRFISEDLPLPLMRKIQRRQLEYEPNVINHDLNTINPLPEPSTTDSFKQNYQRITKKSSIEPNQMFNEEHNEQQLLADYFYYKYLDKLINVILNRNSDDPKQAINEMTRFINQEMMPIR